MLNNLVADLHSLVGGTKKQRRLYQKGIDAAIKVLNSDQFKYAVLDFSYTDSNGLKYDNFKRNYSQPWMDYEYYKKEIASDSMSNQDIYDLIMSGWDQYTQEKDGDIDVSAKLYYKRFSKTKGYVNSGDPTIHTNVKFWQGKTDEEIIATIAGNVVHEYIHLMGFGHEHRNNSTRIYTVPYAIGNIVYNLVLESDLVDGILETEVEYDRVINCYRPWYFLFLREVCVYETVGV